MRSAWAIESARSESAFGVAIEPADSVVVVPDPSLRTGMRRVDVTVVLERVTVVVESVDCAEAVPTIPNVRAAAIPSATRFIVIILTFFLLSRW
jgi:hypothetical protein